MGRVDNQEYDMYVLNCITETYSIKSTEVDSEMSRKDLTGRDGVTCTSRSRPKVCKGDIRLNLSKETQSVFGVVFRDWNEKEKLKRSTWRESEMVKRVM